MKILIYQHQYPAFGGIETVTTLLARQFSADGHRVRIVSVHARSGTKQLEQLPPDTWHLLPSENIDAEENFGALKDELKSFSPDVILFQDSYAPIEGILFRALRASNCHAPVVVCEHNSPLYWWYGQAKRPWTLRGIAFRLYRPVFYLREYLRQRRRRQFLMTHAARYVVLAQAYVSQIRLLVGSELSARVSVVYNPVPPQTDLTVATKEKILLFVGSLIARKGVRRIIAAWAQLESRQKEWRLEIVGDGPLRTELEEDVRRRGLKRVTFAGHQANTESYYRRASILAVASDFEGWPMVIGEAMQAGCVPVVYDSFAAASEMIEAPVSGRVVRHYDQMTYVAALDDLMADPVKREKISDRARTKVQTYALGRVADEWYSLFCEVGKK